MTVHVGSAHLQTGKGLLIQDVTISQREQSDDSQPMLQIDEIFIATTAGVQELLQDTIEIEKIIIRRPQATLKQLSDGTWNVESLMPLPKFGTGELNLVLEDGQVQITSDNPKAEALILRGINLSANRPALADTALLPNQETSPPISFDVKLAASFSERIHCSGTYSKASHVFKLKGDFAKLNISKEWLESLPVEMELSQPLPKLSGILDFSFSLSGSLSAPESIQFAIHQGSLHQGRLRLEKLQLPLSDVSAQWSCNNEGLEVHQIRGLLGQTAFSANARREGWEANAPVGVGINLKKLPINRNLLLACPEPIRKLWDNYHPEGEVDLISQLVFDGEKWKNLKTKITCRELLLLPKKFPYRLQHGHGVIELVYQPEQKTDLLTVDLLAMAGGQAVRVQSRLSHLGPRAMGWALIQASGIPVDDSLIDALPEKAKQFISSLHPTGKVDVVWQSLREDPNAEKPNYELAIKLHEGAIAYEKFSYPLRQISGDVFLKDNLWTFKNLRGLNNAGRILCNGQMVLKPLGPEIALDFQCENITLSEDLRTALSPAAQNLWLQIRPRGQCNLRANIQILSGQKKPLVSVVANPVADTVSIEPQFFPYRMDHFEGTLVIEKGIAKLHGIRAKHGQTELRAAAESRFTDDGQWQFELNHLSVDRLKADRDLLIALPPGLSRLVSSLNPHGTFNLHDSQLAFAVTKQTGETLQTKWNLHFGLQQATLQTGLLLENINGVVTLTGEANAKGQYTFGDLNIDSLTHKDIQVTQIRGPLWANERYVLLGQWATRQQQGERDRALTGKAYGGTLVGNGRIQHADKPQFSLDLSYTDGDISRVAMQHFPGPNNLKGRMYGNLELGGSGNNAAAIRRSLIGRGKIRLIDAEVYELPQMVAMLKVLRARQPNTKAFKHCEATFQVAGEQLQLKDIELRGDALTLYGEGAIGFDKRVNMAFNAVVLKVGSSIPLLHSILREASGQVMQLNVHGTLQNPQFTSEPLPGLNNVLQKLQAELEPTGRPNSPRNSPTRNNAANRLFGPPSRR